MTTRICDKCRQEVEKLEQVRPEYGNYELCSPCMDEINNLVTDYKKRWLIERDCRIESMFEEWVNAKPKPKTIFQRIFQL